MHSNFVVLPLNGDKIIIVVIVAIMAYRYFPELRLQRHCSPLFTCIPKKLRQISGSYHRGISLLVRERCPILPTYLCSFCVNGIEDELCMTANTGIVRTNSCIKGIMTIELLAAKRSLRYNVLYSP